MSGIDWGKAPNWAKGHGLVVQGSIKEVWFGDFSYMVVGDNRAYPYGGGIEKTRHNHTVDAIQFKTMRPEPWSGDGLPPAGTVCEWKEKPGFQWVAATVLFITESSVVMQRSDGFEWQMLTKRTVFRPIRTPEQIAAELRVNTINEMRDIILNTVKYASGIDAANYAEVLFEAGYRKQAKS